MKLPIQHPKPDIQHFARVIRGEVIPARPPLAELFLDQGVLRTIGEEFLGLTWTPPVDLPSRLRYREFQIDVYHALGYDYFWVFGTMDFPRPRRESSVGDGRSWAENDAGGPIQSREDLEGYPWPRVTEEALAECHYVAARMPDGMGMFVAHGDGFLEAVMNNLVGYESMCMMLYDDPELLRDIIDRAGQVVYDAAVAMADVPRSAGVFMGDDMGFTTSTLFPPDFYRSYILPWHRKLAEAIHRKGQLYMLHSCGKIDEIMPDFIRDVKIDAKHSFQRGAYDIVDYKKEYGKDIALLGGVDVDQLCRLEEAELRAYVRGILDACMPGGRYALGSGNSITTYVPLQNYFIMLEEGLRYG